MASHKPVCANDDKVGTTERLRGRREGREMRRRVLIAAVATLIGSVGAGVARADKPPVEFAGQPFYFSLTCTGIGGVIVVNQSLARPAALLVVGSQTVVIGPFNGAPGPARVANAQCTLTGAGFTIDTIEPVEPVTAPVLIVGA